MAATGLTYKYKTADMVMKLIIINSLLFLAFRLVAFFMQIRIADLTNWLTLPENTSEFITQPWAFITYSFVHFGFFHILFNMIWLYMFGRIILNYFSGKRLLTIYLLGAIVGGLFFVFSYNVFPVFENDRGFLLGASGAVTALMAFIATYSPNTQLRIFTFNIKLWHIAVFLIVADLVRISTSDNPGGLLAHLGGAVFGYFYAVQLAKGKDIGKWFENILDWFANLFKSRKQKPFKKVHRTDKKGAGIKDIDKTEHQRKVDAILDKIGKSGYDSLSKAEKDYLFKAGKED
ncbi:MAG: rhomboid family intramembrane serine protease [Bacteroidia bacterium]|nr:rhomboid family intramembrane serine protease [Bacteroidia bacterium]NNF30135.1 rhomboid family intramembrane serine protease [Flavobacteriaceae bacterium]NNJ81805.1 rhomboid family intramembrane serine protease [Flavobacteriaceae bacterium]NNK55501.1 rhomboid family intramembrane serine protease [Flavobacteriaceae bacterium]